MIALAQKAHGPLLVSQVIPLHSLPALLAPFLPRTLPLITALVFETPDSQPVLRVALPRLPGMDELAIARASLVVRGQAREQAPVVVAAGSGSAGQTVQLPTADPRTGRLVRVALIDFRPAVGSDHGLQAGGTALLFKPDGSVETGGGFAVPQLHLCVRVAADGGHFGPPLCAAPAFAMPDDPARLYGPALGGASVRATRTAGQVDLSLQLSPGLETRRAQLFLGTTGALSPEGGLPSEQSGVSFTAHELRAYFETEPRDMAIKARVSSTGAPVDVATFPGPLPSDPVRVDFTAGSRGLFDAAYRTSTTADVAIELAFSASAIGEAWVQELSLTAQYRRFPFGQNGVSLALLGAPAPLAMPIAPGLTPQACTVTLDGRFGAARRVDATDADVRAHGHGLALEGPVQIARYIPLSQRERGLPLVRVSVLGRSSAASEVLISLHGGDPERIGARIGAPCALSIPPSAVPELWRGELAGEARGAPHPAGVWVVMRATKGRFYWYGANTPAAEGCRRSPDDGATWSLTAEQPLLQLHVEELDPVSGEPIPEPISVSFGEQLLSADLLQLRQQRAPSAQFREAGVALLGVRAAANRGTPPSLLDVLAQQGESIGLAFHCRRDVALRVLDAALVYDPWEA